MVNPAINYVTQVHGENRQYWSYLDGPWQDYGGASVLSDTSRRQKPESISMPFRADGTRGPTTYYHYWYTGSPPVGSITARATIWPGWKYLSQGVQSTAPTSLDEIVPSYIDSRGYDRAVMKALLRLKDQKVNLGVALGEARKTAELLGKTSETIGKSVDEFMAKNWRKLGRMASWKKFPAKYLELSYGWTPLLNDVVGSAQAVSEAFNQSGMLPALSVQGLVKATDTVFVSVNHTRGIGMYSVACSVKEKHGVYLTYHLPSNILSDFSSLGLTNPLELGWELLPYSFVIDWVVPIGDWLSALDAGAFLEFKEGSYSRIQRVASERTILTPIDYWFDVDDGGKGFSLRGGRFNRSVIHSAPIPSYPSLRSPLSLDKMAKGLALLTQVFQKWR